MKVIVYYNPKRKCLEIKDRHKGSRMYDKPVVLKRTHALNLGEASISKRTLTGSVDLDEVHSLEEKKSPRPKWKTQVRADYKKGKFIKVKDDEELKHEDHGSYHPRVFVEDCKIFVL